MSERAPNERIELLASGGDDGDSTTTIGLVNVSKAATSLAAASPQLDGDRYCTLVDRPIELVPWRCVAESKLVTNTGGGNVEQASTNAIATTNIINKTNSKELLSCSSSSSNNKLLDKKRSSTKKPTKTTTKTKKTKTKTMTTNKKKPPQSSLEMMTDMSANVGNHYIISPNDVDEPNDDDAVKDVSDYVVDSSNSNGPICFSNKNNEEGNLKTVANKPTTAINLDFDQPNHHHQQQQQLHHHNHRVHESQKPQKQQQQDEEAIKRSDLSLSHQIESWPDQASSSSSFRQQQQQQQQQQHQHQHQHHHHHQQQQAIDTNEADEKRTNSNDSGSGFLSNKLGSRSEQQIILTSQANANSNNNNISQKENKKANRDHLTRAVEQTKEEFDNNNNNKNNSNNFTPKPNNNDTNEQGHHKQSSGYDSDAGELIKEQAIIINHAVHSLDNHSQSYQPTSGDKISNDESGDQVDSFSNNSNNNSNSNCDNNINNNSSLAPVLNKHLTNNSTNQNKNSRNKTNNNNNSTSKQITRQQQPATATASEIQQQQQQQQQQQDHLSHLQKFFLKRWPVYALAICMMAALIFALLSSTLSVYLICGSQFGAANATPAKLQTAIINNGQSLVAPITNNNNNRELQTVAHLTSQSAANYKTASSALDDSFGGDSGGGGGSGSGNGESGSRSTEVLAANSNNNSNFTRLPSSLWPIHYDLFIQPYIREPFEFYGKVKIRIKCTSATNNITLHARELELDRSSLTLTAFNEDNNKSSSKSSISSSSATASIAPSIVDLTQDTQLQYSIIHLDDYLIPGREYVVTISFKGLLNDELAGFYRIKYEDQNGKTTWIAATQFQPTDARKAFPCFDEPLYKATFGITIKHWTNMSALSNMPLVSSNYNETRGWVVDKFEVSHRMSTYLVAFAVTNYESKTLGNITVWTRPGFIDTAVYALNITGKILKHYETFFGIDFPLPKMDMIALPDFNAGAMENWGLITYRETAMLYDEKISSVSNKQRVATVVAHELAHQWFGNLVTPKWWDDLWLNEGFASYVEYIGVNHVEPGWKMLDQFVVDEIQDVLKADSLSTSHQISIPVNNPDEINEIFDRISYGKGASIIRMMNHFLTEEVFKAGLRNYLRALKYGNAEQSDLWHHLTEAQYNLTKNQIVDVKKVMNSWTLQTGFPLVTLTRDYSNNTAKLEQNRFQILSKEGTPTDRVSKWEIPITMTSAKELDWIPRTKFWMHQDDEGPLILDSSLVPNANQWMLVNVDQVGYYRVNYDTKNWQLLIQQLVTNHASINPINRAQILDDVFDLAKNGLIDYRFAMNATKYLKRETDFLAWDTILRSFIFIDDMLKRSPVYGEWKEYISELIEEFYNNYKDQSWTMDEMIDASSKNDVLAQYNRVNAISWACQVNKHCIGKARRLFEDWKNTGVNNIDPSLRSILYCNVIENGDKSDCSALPYFRALR